MKTEPSRGLLMDDTKTELIEFLANIPEADKIRQRLAENIHEAKLLRRLLKIAEQRERVEEVASCND